MSEPYSYTCPACGWCNSHAPDCIYRPKPPNAHTRALLASYVEFRRECIALEELIATGAFTKEEANRLDRGVTVMKVGFKLVKKVLRTRGVEGRLKPDAELAEQPTDTPKPDSVHPVGAPATPLRSDSACGAGSATSAVLPDRSAS